MHLKKLGFSGMIENRMMKVLRPSCALKLILQNVKVGIANRWNVVRIETSLAVAMHLLILYKMHNYTDTVLGYLVYPFAPKKCKQ